MTVQKKSEDKVTRNIVIGTVIFVLVAVGALVYQNKKPVELSQAIPSLVTSDNGYAISFNAGLTSAPVVDIYEDFQCPVCMQFEGVNMQYISSLVSEKKAVVHFHILSFIGEESKLAANAAACANEEGQFVAYHNSLYANQPAAENSGEWSNERLIEIAKTIGIKSDSFAQCVNDGTFLGWVEKVAAAGAKSGVNATPTVFVNGKEIDRKTAYFSAPNFKAAVEG